LGNAELNLGFNAKVNNMACPPLFETVVGLAVLALIPNVIHILQNGKTFRQKS
jgi:hypothetical protein